MDASRHVPSPLVRPLAALALVLALLALGGGAWLGQSGTAVAPEPARLSSDLVGFNGATAAAVYTYSNAPTSVLKWSGSWVNVSPPPTIGTPCSTVNMLNGDITLKVIRGVEGGGNWRRCY